MIHLFKHSMISHFTYANGIWIQINFSSNLLWDSCLSLVHCPIKNWKLRKEIINFIVIILRGIFFFMHARILLKEKFHYIPWLIDLLYLRIKLPPASLKFKINKKKNLDLSCKILKRPQKVTNSHRVKGY